MCSLLEQHRRDAVLYSGADQRTRGDYVLYHHVDGGPPGAIYRDRQDPCRTTHKCFLSHVRFRVITQDPKRQLRQALPMVVGSSSSILNKWPSQSQTRGCCPRSPVTSQLGQDKKPSFLQAQDAPTEQYQQDDEYLCSAVLDRFPCGQIKDTIKTFL